MLTQELKSIQINVVVGVVVLSVFVCNDPLNYAKSIFHPLCFSCAVWKTKRSLPDIMVIFAWSAFHSRVTVNG